MFYIAECRKAARILNSFQGKRKIQLQKHGKIDSGFRWGKRS